MTRLLYVDCVAGAAGDMLLGALLDAGADVDHVQRGLVRLPLQDLTIELRYEERAGIQAARVSVPGVEEQTHRSWRQVREMIDAGELPDRARSRAHAAFRMLAEAEGQIHGIAPEDVQFHEVGARDAIADVCGFALALEALDIERVVSSPLPAARGFVEAAHGKLPLPAPATLELLRGVPIYGLDADAELVTPTGAALLAAVADDFGLLPPLRLEAVGYGAGSRDLGSLPNVVRVLLGEGSPAGSTSPVSLIEANIDDLAPELVPDAAAKCVDAGALDVWTTAVQMKKGRPAVVLSALARPAQERAVAEAVLRETSTLGVRMSHLTRWELDREWCTVEVAGQPVRVKLGRLDGEVVNVAPEHADCAALADKTGDSVKSIWEAAFAAATRLKDHQP